MGRAGAAICKHHEVSGVMTPPDGDLPQRIGHMAVDDTTDACSGLLRIQPEWLGDLRANGFVCRIAIELHATAQEVVG